MDPANLSINQVMDLNAATGLTGIQTRGVGKDVDGNIWVADSGNDYVYKFDTSLNYLGKVTTDPAGTEDCEPVGVSGDLYGNVWVVNNSCDNVIKIPKDISLTGDNSTLVEEGDTMIDPYSYSDFVGFSLFNSVLNPQGTWAINFDSGYSAPQWEDIRWRAKVNEQTTVYVSVKVAATEEDLETADTYGPYFDSPASLTSVPELRWIQVIITFETENPEGITPVLEDFSIGFSLPE